ncbi:MAG: hypothetical protein ABW001_08170 [Mycobacterium sp.]
MDLVLGLSLTSAAVRWVLVEGTTGEGDPIDRGELDIPAIDDLDADLLLRAVLNPDVIAENRIRVVGVTCTTDALPAAGAVVDALEARGHHDVVSISDSAAVAALASGIAAITEYDRVAVCIVEPDSAFVAQVAGGEVAVESIDRPQDRADAIELTSSVIAVLDPDHRPDAIFVVGSDDVDVIVSSFEAIIESPVFSATEADLALARGAALACARTLDMSDPETQPAGSSSRIGVLSAVLAAAVVVFVVSLSIAVGLNMTQDSPAVQTENASAAGEPEPKAVPLADPVQPVVRFPDASPVLAKTMVIAAPPAPVPVVAPVYQPPPAAVPVAPPPAYQPPAPVYVPPVPQQPRLRDRIIERIPIINRFHDP